MMDRKNKKKMPEKSGDQVPTDAEIEAAAQRLGSNWARSGARSPAGRAGQIRQSLAHGRSRTVAVEIKRPPRR